MTLIDHFRKGGWLAKSPETLEKWLADLKRTTHGSTSRGGADLLPSVKAFQDFIENDGDMYMGIHQMFEGATEPYPLDYLELVSMLDGVFRMAPSYVDTGPHTYTVLGQAMNTQAGFRTFLTEKFNLQFQDMFKEWSDFLLTPASTHVLSSEEGGWLSPPALEAMDEHFGIGFENIFVCEPDVMHYGFSSWDTFFNREFRNGVRAVEFPLREDMIGAACESNLLRISTKVKECDTFWLKHQPYSLRHMLNNDHFTGQFVGGTVFQGFLELTGYHRWHAPVSGVIRKIVQVPGTFFVQAPEELGRPTAEHPYLNSICYISAITARMLIFIESDNPSIGLMCFIALGMTEISSCEATVKQGQRIARGEELGMFHFGGSSHCLVFRPETTLEFVDGCNKEGDHIKCRAAIARVAMK